MVPHAKRRQRPAGTWECGWSFIKRAGTVIVLSAIVIWLLSNLGVVNGKFGMVSILYEDETVCTEEYKAFLFFTNNSLDCSAENRYKNKKEQKSPEDRVP